MADHLQQHEAYLNRKSCAYFRLYIGTDSHLLSWQIHSKGSKPIYEVTVQIIVI